MSIMSIAYTMAITWHKLIGLDFEDQASPAWGSPVNW